ncbi:FAR1-related protein, partial [Striga asiatica]
ITEINRDVRVDISPGSTQYYTPLCDHDLKPFVGQEFKTLDDGLQFYKKYAVECGFDIRRSTLSKSNDVVYDKSQNTATCSCKKFVRVGLLCCHVFYVFKDLNLQSIPEKYLVPRWTKYASLKPIFEVHGQIIDQCAMIEERKSIMNQLFSEFYSCIGFVEGNNDFMTSLLHSLKNQRLIFTSGVDQSSATSSKKKLFEDYYGGSVPQKVQVLPPLPVKMKGSGSRLKSRKEKTIEKSNKPLRRCSKCRQKTNHDARNCVKS